MKHCGKCECKMDVKLEVNEQTIEMQGFVQNIVGSTILGMVKTLKGVKEPKEILLRINAK